MTIISCSVDILKSPYNDLVGKEGIMIEEKFIEVVRNGKKTKYKINWNTWEFELNSATMQFRL